MLRAIPLEPYPHFTQQSELDGVTYSFEFRWSQRAACWHLDLRTPDDLPIALSVRLVTGFPLLRRVTHPQRPAGELWMLDLSGPGEEPTLEGLGTRFVLFYVDAAGLYA